MYAKKNYDDRICSFLLPSGTPPFFISRCHWVIREVSLYRRTAWDAALHQLLSAVLTRQMFYWFSSANIDFVTEVYCCLGNLWVWRAVWHSIIEGPVQHFTRFQTNHYFKTLKPFNNWWTKEKIKLILNIFLHMCRDLLLLENNIHIHSCLTSVLYCNDCVFSPSKINWVMSSIGSSSLILLIWKPYHS